MQRIERALLKRSVNLFPSEFQHFFDWDQYFREKNNSLLPIALNLLILLCLEFLFHEFECFASDMKTALLRRSVNRFRIQNDSIHVIFNNARIFSPRTRIFLLGHCNDVHQYQTQSRSGTKKYRYQYRLNSKL